MNTRFFQTVERPLRLLLNQESVESGHPVPASRSFDRPQAVPALPHAPALRFDRILVPTDFSCYSTAALAYACQLAAKLGGEVILLHVTPTPSHGDAPDGGEKHRRLAQSQIEGQLFETGAATQVRTLIREGIPHKTIVLEALSQNADLIVMAKHGHSDEIHLLLGKTAEFLVRNAHCPVLLVGEEGAIFPAHIPIEE